LGEVVTICDHLKKLRFSYALPFAFTEHGAVMLATVLNSAVAVQTSIQVVKAFIKLSEMLASSKELSRRIDALEKKYDTQFKVVFKAIRSLMNPPEKPKEGDRVREGMRVCAKIKYLPPRCVVLGVLPMV